MAKREHWMSVDVPDNVRVECHGEEITATDATTGEPWMPWKPHTPQVNGRKAEKVYAKKIGARLHSNSGAGSEKEDMTHGDEVIEYKNTAKSHTLNGEKLAGQLLRALHQGKDAKYIVYFEDHDVTLEGTLHRGR